MAGERRVDRRTVLRGAATTAALAGAGVSLRGSAANAQSAFNEAVPVRMAMHVHASFSEGGASMQSHLSEATRTGVDVIWWTEHDHRMVARHYLSDVHFNGLTEWTGGTSVTWRSSTLGNVGSSSATIVSSPVSPNDVGDKALRLYVASSADTGGTRTLTAEARNSGLTTSIDGTTISLDVHPVVLGPDAWFDLVVITSYRPATGGRPPGQYRMRYRVGGGRPPASEVLLEPLDGLIVLDAASDTWTTLTVDLVADFARFWPDLDFRDAALLTFAMSLTSRARERAEVVVDALRFDRVRKGPKAVLEVQRELMDHYTPLYPTVVQRQGLEVSENTPHLNWFGNPQIWPESDPANQDVGLAIEKIHAGGGVASYNHPFGTSGGYLSTSQRSTKRRALTSTLLAERVFGADVLEVGYTGGRAGMLQSDYIAMWDVLSRNLVLTTGTGVTDDHGGANWLTQRWRHVTGVWAADTEVASLQDALRAGRAWFSDLGVYNGTIDLIGAGFVPMGSVGLVDTERCRLDIQVTDMPLDWQIVVVSGVADEAGTTALDPVVTSRSFGSELLVDGVLSIKVRSSESRFHRVGLRDPEGNIRAYSNPLWLLRTPPAAALVPDHRWAVPPAPAQA